MYKNLIYSSSKADIGSISKAEVRVGHNFPNGYLEFCQEYNGAKLKNAKISLSKGEVYEVRQFTPVHSLGISTVELWDDNLIAIAEDSGGNYFVFKKPELGSVYYWDHETEDLKHLCDSFLKFLKLIEEDDYSDLPSPENAKSWVNPAFLQKQKDLGNA